MNSRLRLIVIGTLVGLSCIAATAVPLMWSSDVDAQQGCRFFSNRTGLGLEKGATAITSSGMDIKTGGYNDAGYWFLACSK